MSNEKPQKKKKKVNDPKIKFTYNDNDMFTICKD